MHDEDALRKIADALEIKSNDIIVEIGPGHGELTKYLAEAEPGKIIAIEKDKKLAYKLQQSIKNTVYSKTLEVIEGDVLKIIPLLHTKYSILNTSYKIVGNIPYYITGYLLRILGKLENKPSLIVFTMQKEVAERICAKPPKMNLLAASVQFWAKPEIVGFISKKSFSPAPEVDSAIIKIVPKTIKKGLEKQYYQLIKILFKQPRKMILNNLSAEIKISKEEITKKLTRQGIKPNTRPQNLTMQDLTTLSNVFSDKK